MKMIQLGLMIFLSVFCGCRTNHSTTSTDGATNAADKSLEAADNSMKVSNSIKALTIVKVEVSLTGNIAVELSNSSKEPLKGLEGLE
jgi:hypothetical protein